MPKNDSGKMGEAAAANYLIKKGYIIKDKNVRFRVGEIDIVALDGECLVFIEVKTRRYHSYGIPSDFVDRRKQEKLRQSALLYLDGADVDFRFDVIGITYEMYNGRYLISGIEHIENAF